MNKIFILLSIVLSPVKAFAQEDDSVRSHWNFSAWAEMFILPGQSDFFNPTFYARHNNLHLEGRYNYEDLNTGSIWAGRRFKFGKSVKFVTVPMGAIVFGNTNGMAPGLEIEVLLKKFDFYSESEYVFDFKSSENNYFYVYSELAVRPIQPIRTGMVVQRTKVIDFERELERGIFGEYYFNRFRAGLFYFSPFSTDQFWIASVSIDF
jgi:hypothetical protein